MKNIKKILLVTIIAIEILFSLCFSSLASGTATVIKADIKLRKEKDDTSTILELIPKGEEIEVVQQEGEWYQVRYLKIRGYVREDEIQVTNSNTNSTKDTNTVDNTVLQDTPDDTNTITQPSTDTGNNAVTPLQKGEIAVVKQETNIQIRPVINASVIGSIKPEKDITILEILNHWAYVSTQENIGWIRFETLSKKEEVKKTSKQEETEQKTQTKKTETTITKTGYIASEDVNFRKEPNTESTVLTVLSKNTKITIIEEQTEWIKATYDGKTGYISKQFVSDKKVETTSRSSGTRTKMNTVMTTNTSTKQEEIVNYAKQFLGCSYVYGGETPTKGFDCSGFTKYVFKHFGISLTHSATAQSKVGTKIAKEDLQLGDIVFFSDYKTYQGIGHCGIYIGDNKFIHASTETTGVITSSLLKGSYVKRYVTATRLI